MILHLSVNHSVHRGGGGVPGRHTPLDRYTPPPGRYTPQQAHPQAGTPPR